MTWWAGLLLAAIVVLMVAAVVLAVLAIPELEPTEKGTGDGKE